ncbi:MAG: toll/interleukin-1 receptor domain-containing protein [Geminicoccaceae bacterium]
MARIFVSYAHEDKEAAHQIAAALTDAGLEPWLDVQELRGGAELLRTIAEVLAEAAYFAIALTRRALTKPWVLAEMRMALTREIEQGRPKVVVLLLDDCEVPTELRHKIYLDFRGRFDAAVTELADHLRGVAGAAPTPKQTILAEMIRDADAELWARLGAGTGAAHWSQSEAADVIRELRSPSARGGRARTTRHGKTSLWRPSGARPAPVRRAPAARWDGWPSWAFSRKRGISTTGGRHSRPGATATFCGSFAAPPGAAVCSRRCRRRCPSA